MTDQEKIAVIENIPLFKSLDSEAKKLIAAATKEKDIPSHTEFITQGDISDGAYLLIEGNVRIFRLTEEGESVTLAVLGSGEVIGEMSLVDDEPRSASVETLKTSKMLLLTKHEFSNLLSTHPQIAISLMGVLTKRMRALNEYIEDLLSKNLYDRTLKSLETIAQYFPNREVTLSQEELSAVIGATRARVTEVLNDLQNDGKITLSHRKIHVL